MINIANGYAQYISDHTYNTNDNEYLDIALLNNYSIYSTNDLLDRLRHNFIINYPHTQKVQFYEEYYSKHPKLILKFINNAKPYLYYMLTQIERYDLPGELALIPMVESNFDPLIKNTSNDYAGLWQFIPITANRFSLSRCQNIDERLHAVKATNAALLYLQYLYQKFHQWDVAIGAYNIGEGAMMRTINANNCQVGNINDYESLKLRAITINYVAKIIALANIFKHPEKYSLHFPTLPNEPYFIVKSNVVQDAINSISMEYDKDTKSLNPQFKQVFTSNQQDNLQILLPY